MRFNYTVCNSFSSAHSVLQQSKCVFPAFKDASVSTPCGDGAGK